MEVQEEASKIMDSFKKTQTCTKLSAPAAAQLRGDTRKPQTWLSGIPSALTQATGTSFQLFNCPRGQAAFLI